MTHQPKLSIIKSLYNAITPKRRSQLLSLQLLSILAAFGEVANIGALLPFLRLLANPLEGISSLGPLAKPLSGLSSNHLLLILGIGFMVVVVISTLLRLATVIIQLRLAALITTDIADKVYFNVLSKPYPWHLTTNSSNIITFVSRDVDSVYGSLQAVMSFAMNFLVVLLLGGYLISLSPVVMILVAILLASFYLIVYRFTTASIRRDGEQQIIDYQYSVQLVQEAIGGIRDVIIDNTREYFVGVFSKINRSGKLAGAALNTKAQLPRYLIEGFVMLLIVGVSVSLSFSGQGIEKQLPLLGTLVLGAYRLLQPLQLCFASISSINSSQESFKRLSPFLSDNVSRASAQLPHNSIYLSLPSSNSCIIELAHVKFNYEPSTTPILNNLSLKIFKGQRVAFVGSTGSGKSTICDLILGLLVPSDGQILIHGHDLFSSGDLLDDWQSHVAHVPQHIFLSDDTFASNIAFGIPKHNIDYERLFKAAKQARIADLIDSSPYGYETLVGERGVSLSGGQRQRIGIARALYKKAQLLVLDEATSALDNQTEAEVMDEIEALDSDLTIIIIAHRLSTVKNCDNIFVLSQGHVDGQGSFNELMVTHKNFRDLVQNRQPDQATS